MVGPRRWRDHRGISDQPNSSHAGTPTAPPWPEAPPRPPEGWNGQPWPGRPAPRWWGDRPGRHRGRPFLRFGSGCLRRQSDDRIFGGVAGGLSRRTGVDVTLIRLGFVLCAMFGGFGAAVYVVLWLMVPLEGHSTSIAARAAADRRGIMLSLSFLPALIVTVVVFSALHVGFVTSFAWPVFVSAAGLVLVWRNSDEEERGWIRRSAEPAVHLGAKTRRGRQVLLVRVGVGLALLGGGLALLVWSQRPPAVSVLRPILGALSVLVAIVVLFGPWWLRIARDLVDERQARLRAEDRADMASRVHDSVLQTLALIQRSSGEPQQVVQLARAQERELRAWLFDGELPGTAGEDATSLAAGVRLLAQEVEADHRVTVEVVTVGDCALDDRLRALLAAAREATVNAAKWSGSSSVSLFAEVEPTKVSVFVRDRGRGFDPDEVGSDRRGIAESIQARMLRHRGRAFIRTAPGEGTEIELRMNLATDRK